MRTQQHKNNEKDLRRLAREVAIRAAGSLVVKVVKVAGEVGCWLLGQ